MENNNLKNSKHKLLYFQYIAMFSNFGVPKPDEMYNV